MRGIHTYALLLGFAIGVACFFALKMPPLAVVVGLASVIGINEAMKRRYLKDLRDAQKKLEDEE